MNIQAYTTNNSLSVFSKPLTMSSLEIADYTGKEHKNVMRDIREMLEQLGQLSFEPSYYINSQNREMPMYELDEEHSIALVSGYDVKMRMEIIREWKALKEAHDPMAIMATFDSKQSDLFARVAVQLAKETKQKEQAIIMIEHQKPKVEFFDEVADTEGLMGFNEAAKLIGVGRNKLLAGLRRTHILQSGKLSL